MFHSQGQKTDINRIALTAIGIFCLGYVRFSKTFAELHIQLPFLDFPIFVGEVLLFLCLVMFMAKFFRHRPRTFTKVHYAVMAYFAFVAAKALYGYIVWGPLALRHAALHYYPAFAVFGYVFFDRKIFDKQFNTILGCAIVALFILGKFYIHYLLTLAVLGLIVIPRYPVRSIKYALLVLLLLFIPYERFFLTSRMMILANAATMLFLVVSLAVILKFGKKVKVVGGLLIAGLIALALLKYAPQAALKSMVNIKRIVSVFKARDQVVKDRINDFRFKERETVYVYNPESNLANNVVEKATAKMMKDQVKKAYLAQIVTNIEENPEEFYETMEDQIKTMHLYQYEKKIPLIVLEDAKDEILEEYQKEVKKTKIFNDQQEALKTGEWVVNDNAVFRLLIWRDMLADLFREFKILGFDYGKPFRSVSLEILDWGTGDWARDGWVSAHNSYLHIVYRSGVVGVAFIVAILFVLGRMIKAFILARSATGLLLCGIIINWFVAANFLVTFELPYTAIPIWTIYGMTFGYYHQLKAKSESREAPPRCAALAEN